MEEDIKNLEEIINLCKEELDKNDLNISAVLDFIDLKSLRNLLKKYKEQKGEIQILKDQIEYVINEYGDTIDEQNERIKDLEEENKKLKEYIFIAPNLDEMTAIKYMKIQEEGYIKGRAEEQQKARELIHKHYIPKSLIKEKIEERKLWLSSNDIGYKDDYVLEVLEELLNGKM